MLSSMVSFLVDLRVYIARVGIFAKRIAASQGSLLSMLLFFTLFWLTEWFASLHCNKQFDFLALLKGFLKFLRVTLSCFG